jgi:hypothetical protein
MFLSSQVALKKRTFFLKDHLSYMEMCDPSIYVFFFMLKRRARCLSPKIADLQACCFGCEIRCTIKFRSGISHSLFSPYQYRKYAKNTPLHFCTAYTHLSITSVEFFSPKIFSAYFIFFGVDNLFTRMSRCFMTFT